MMVTRSRVTGLLPLLLLPLLFRGAADGGRGRAAPAVRLTVDGNSLRQGGGDLSFGGTLTLPKELPAGLTLRLLAVRFTADDAYEDSVHLRHEPGGPLGGSLAFEVIHLPPGRYRLCALLGTEDGKPPHFVGCYDGASPPTSTLLAGAVIDVTAGAVSALRFAVASGARPE